MKDKLYVLLDEKQMMENLVQVDDNNHLVEKFYPRLLEHAGQEKTVGGVVMLITLAIEDYSDGMPSLVFKLLTNYIPKLALAITGEFEVADASKEWLK